LKQLSKASLKKGFFRLTLGELKKHAEQNGISDDAVIMVERVEDHYYETGGWGVYTKKAGGIKTEYTPATVSVCYPNEKDLLFIHLHY